MKNKCIYYYTTNTYILSNKNLYALCFQLLKQETDRLLSLAASAEAELVSGDTVALPEEAAGKLRSAAGKARLLTSQKMQQFEGLCQKNIVRKFLICFLLEALNRLQLTARVLIF